jgi:hypothetical protein
MAGPDKHAVSHQTRTEPRAVPLTLRLAHLALKIAAQRPT